MAGGHDRRRLYALDAGARLSGHHDQHDHAHTHRRADLPAPELPRADRKSSGQPDRAGSGRRGRYRGAQVDRRIRRFARHPHGAARHHRRRVRHGGAHPRMRHDAAKLHRLRIPGRPARVVVRHRRRSARSAAAGRPRNRVGQARPRRRVQRQQGIRIPPGRGWGFLQIIELSAAPQGRVGAPICGDGTKGAFLLG